MGEDLRHVAQNLIDGKTVTRAAVVEVLETAIAWDGRQDAYADALLEITGAVVGVERYNFWALIRATPEQRARAFLAATEGI